MGIISTGLGFTESSGKISQSFIVGPSASTLSLDWNFLSEEFLEFVGSQFQDFFRVSIERPGGAVDVVFERSIDDLAGDELIPLQLVSPTIVFDIGDVYMTDWQTLTIDMTPYRREIITVRLAAGDVGDSIFDTAILLDRIAVN